MSGNVNINGASSLGNTNDSIAKAVNLTVNENLTINAGQVTLDSATDTIAVGKEVAISAGTLNLDTFATSSSTGKINATGGNVILNGTNELGSGDIIAEAVVTELKDNASLNIVDANVTLNSGIGADILGNNSAVNVNGGTLNLKDFTTVNGKGVITANSGSVNISGSNTLGAGDTINKDAALSLNNSASLDLTNATVTLDSASDTLNADSKISVNGGTLNLDTFATSASSGSIDAVSGNVNIMNGTTTLGNVNDQILYAVNTKVATGAGNKLEIKDGLVQLDGTDTLESGTLHLNGTNANLHLDGITTENVNLDADSGNLVFERNTVILDNENDDITYLVIAKVDVGAGNNLNLKKGTTRLDSGDNLVSGTLLLDSGSTANLYLDGVTTQDVNLKAVEGNVIIDGINGNTTTLSNVNDSIEKAVKTSILGGATLTVNAGSVVLNDISNPTAGTDNDIWAGNLALADNGNITLDNVSKKTTTNSKYNQTGGNLHLTNGSNLELTSGSVISEGTVNIASSKLSVNNAVDNRSKVIMADGTLEVVGNSTYNLNNSSNITGGNVLIGNSSSGAGKINLEHGRITTAATVNIAENSVLNLNSTSSPNSSVVVLNGTGTDADTWAGTIDVTNGNLGLKDMTVDLTTGPKFSQAGGSTELENSIMTINNPSIITGGDFKLDNTSKLNITNGGITGINNLYSSGLVNTVTGSFEQHKISNDLVVNNTPYTSLAGTAIDPDAKADFSLDITARSNSNKNYDKYNIGGNITGLDSDTQGTINIANWNYIGNPLKDAAPIDREIEMQIFNANGTINPNINFTASEQEMFTPIGSYQLQNRGGGKYALALTSYNPQVFRGQVATIAQWQNQLLVNDLLLDHGSLISRFTDEDKNVNKYAAIMPQNAPYQYSKKDGGLWVKFYGNFERLNMNRGLDVGNNAYGTLFGADFGVKEMKNGWSFIPSAYLGYNGAHQYFNGVSIYEDGGQIGTMGTFYKDKLATSVLGYAGAYGSRQDVAGNNENQFNYFAGIASKTSYDYQLLEDVILQPSMMLSYNFFGNQNWHSNFGAMGMNSGFLNGLNLAPGLNLIWHKDTFSVYLTAAYVYNFMGKVDGRAGNVILPDIKMDHGYFQYGFGATKEFKDRFTGYGQVTFRNGGRTGVGFQTGLQWLLGPSAPISSSTMTNTSTQEIEQIQPTVITPEEVLPSTTKKEIKSETKKQLKTETKKAKKPTVKPEKNVSEVKKQNKPISTTQEKPLNLTIKETKKSVKSTENRQLNSQNIKQQKYEEYQKSKQQQAVNRQKANYVDRRKTTNVRPQTSTFQRKHTMPKKSNSSRIER